MKQIYFLIACLAVHQLNCSTQDAKPAATSPLNPNAKEFISMDVPNSLYTSLQIAPEQTDTITAMALSSDRQLLVYAAGRNIIVRNTNTTALVDKFVADHEPIHSLAVNSRMIVSQSGKSALEIRKIVPGQNVADTLQPNDGNTREVPVILETPREIKAFAIPLNTDGVIFAHGNKLSTWQNGQLEEKEHHDDHAMLLLKMKLISHYPHIFDKKSLSDSYLHVLKEHTQKMHDRFINEPATIMQSNENHLVKASNTDISLWNILSGLRTRVLHAPKKVTILTTTEKTTSIAAGLEDGSVYMWHLKPLVLSIRTQGFSNSQSSSSHFSQATSSAHQPLPLKSPTRSVSPLPPTPSNSSNQKEMTIDEYLATRDDYIGRYYSRFEVFDPRNPGPPRLKKEFLEKQAALEQQEKK